MKLIKKLRIPITLVSAWLILSSWGYKGHEIIGKNFTLSFNNQMTQFQSWVPILANHSGDADKRKAWDKTEGNKHYIDIDSYPEFINNGKINQDINELIKLHSKDFVNKQGILPWATVNTFDTLVACFKRHDFDKAAITAADLSHYIGDGHMPFHSSANYDGQLTGNKGIHSRYESVMINKHAKEIEYTVSPVFKIDDVTNFIFNYIYESHGYIDSILHADNYAKKVTSSTKSDAYTDTLWARTHSLTIDLFQKSSNALAALIYTAWVNAGSPSFGNHVFSNDLVKFKTMLSAVYYRDSTLVVEFGLNKPAEINCEVFGENQNKIITKNVGYFDKGLHDFKINVEIPKGSYQFIFSYNNTHETRTFSVW